MLTRDEDVWNCFLTGLLEEGTLDGVPLVHVVQVEEAVGQTLVLEQSLHTPSEGAVGLGKHLERY